MKVEIPVKRDDAPAGPVSGMQAYFAARIRELGFSEEGLARLKQQKWSSREIRRNFTLARKRADNR